MTVAEMIAELKKCDPNKEVLYIGNDDIGFFAGLRTKSIKEFPDNINLS